MKKSLHERIAILEAKKARDQARLSAMRGRKKAADRKLDGRRKIIVGAIVMTEMERDPKFAAYIRKMLDKALSRPQDREALTDLLSAAAEVTAPASNANAPPTSATPGGTLPGSPFPPGSVNHATGSSYPLRLREKVNG